MKIQYPYNIEVNYEFMNINNELKIFEETVLISNSYYENTGNIVTQHKKNKIK